MTRHPLEDLAIAVLFGIVGLTVTACDAPDSRQHQTRTSNGSDGVQRMVVNGQPELTGPFPDSPVLEIGGGLETEDGADFYRVAGAACLHNTTIVVGDRSSREVRYFAADGQHLVSVGGFGAGPGEFARLSSFHRMGPHAVLVFDQAARRLTAFGGCGELMTTWPVVPPFGERPYMWPVAANDRTVWLRTGTPVVPADSARVVRPYERLYRGSIGGGALELVDSFPGAYRFEGPGVQVGMLPYGAKALFAANASTLAIAWTDTLRVRLYGADGDLYADIQTELAGEIVSEANKQRARDSILGRARAHPLRAFGRAREMLAETMPFPTYKPAAFAAILDDATRLWLIRRESGSNQLLVLAGDGRFLARWVMPHGLQITDVCSHYVVGIRVADDDTESLVLYARRFLEREIQRLTG